MIRLKELRKENTLTQEHLAQKLGITRGAYANIENGRREPDLNTLTILSNLYCVSFDYLVGRTDAKKEPPTIVSDDEGLDPLDAQLMGYVRQMSPDQKKMLLAQIRSFRAMQAETSSEDV